MSNLPDRQSAFLYPGDVERPSHFMSRLAEIVSARPKTFPWPTSETVEGIEELRIAVEASAAWRRTRRKRVDLLLLLQAEEPPPPRPRPMEDWARTAIWESRKRARVRKLDFDITQEMLEQLLRDQNYRCALSGIEFSEWKPDGCHKRPFMPSVDRINSRLGYTRDNVRILCVAVNTLLQDWGDEVFRTILKAAKQ